MALDLDVIQQANNQLFKAQQDQPDIIANMQKMSALKTMGLQQQDIASQVQERTAKAAQEQAALQRGTAAAQVIHDHVAAGGSLDDPELQQKLYAVDPTIGSSFTKTRTDVSNAASEALRRKSESDNAAATLDETKKKNVFEQQKEKAAQDRQSALDAQKQAEEAAGTLIAGSEFTTPDANGKPARAAQFRVRQPDGSYKNETRVMGQQIAAPQNPPQPQAPMSPERFTQEQLLKKQAEDAAASKAATAAGNDERLAGVPASQHSKVYSDVQKAEDAHVAAQTASDRMSSVLALARSGNKEAQASAALIGVQAINELANIKRVNQAEISAYGNAGSLIDQLQGKIGKLVAGKPIPDDVLTDMQTLHDELGRTTDAAYQRSLQSIDRTYRSHFASPNSGAGVPVNPATGQQYKVGDSVMVKGVPHKITAITNGKPTVAP